MVVRRLRERRAPPSGPLYAPPRRFSRRGRTPRRSPPRYIRRPRGGCREGPAHRAGRRTRPGYFPPGKGEGIPPGACVPRSCAEGGDRRATRQDGRGGGPPARGSCTPFGNISPGGSVRGRSSAGTRPGSGRPISRGSPRRGSVRAPAPRRSFPRTWRPGFHPGPPSGKRRGKGRGRTAGRADRRKSPAPARRGARFRSPPGRDRAPPGGAAFAGGRSRRKST